MRVLNLYAGIGGNRKLWQDVEVTAVEYNEEIAGIYKDYFPDDTLVIGDAHEYLLKHYKEYDFIWSSPPCQTHSRARFWNSKGGGCEVKYPDMKLWQEIIFLKNYCNTKFVIENVVPFYEPIIKEDAKVGRHLLWSNFRINKTNSTNDADIHKGSIEEFQNHHGFDLSDRKLTVKKAQVLRNCVNPDLGLYIFEQARGIMRQPKSKQLAIL